MEASEIRLTEESHAAFMEYANDAPNWGGTPLISGNVSGSKKRNGNLTDLKRKGLIVTQPDDERPSLHWLTFTGLGRDYSKLHGIDIDWTE